MVIWLVMVTVPPMIWPFTPPALLLPKSTLQGLYTNNFMLSLKFVLFDTLMSYGAGIVELLLSWTYDVEDVPLPYTTMPFDRFTYPFAHTSCLTMPWAMSAYPCAYAEPAITVLLDREKFPFV